MGAKADSVIYEVPELSFSPVITAGYINEMKALCPGCNVRKVDIPLASIGSDATSRIVSDLQSHPETTMAVFSDLDDETGLPAALKTAGISVQMAGNSPSPSGLQDIKDGVLGAGLAVDLPVMFWTGVDMIARVATGQPPTAGEKAGIPSEDLLEQADITFDPSKGFSGYPDYVQRFTAMWKG
jgi:ribose transport system substrate-binding protein